MRIFLQLILLWLVSGYSGISFAEFHDPTRPYILQDKGMINNHNPLVLTAIYIAPDRRIAVINSTLLKEGDQIQGARVATIEPNYVILDNSGEKMVLYLVEQPVKRKLLNQPIKN